MASGWVTEAVIHIAQCSCGCDLSTVCCSDAHQVLYMEADATNEEQALALGKSSSDLSLQQCSQAFRTIESAARAQYLHFDRVMRVFLADSLQPVTTGGGEICDAKCLMSHQ